MAILDVNRLLEPVSGDNPCGPNLEYDDAYTDFERAARGKSEQQYGDTVYPAEEPDWREVCRLGVELLDRTKDLRLACQLARGFVETDQLTDFASDLALIRGYLEQYWPTVHPQLDPEDNNDPTLRVNTLSALNNQSTLLRALRLVPLVSARGLGSFSLRDIGIASGQLPAIPNQEPPKMATIEAAFAECDLDELKTKADAVRHSLEHADAIDSTLMEQVGAENTVSLEDLRKTLQEVEQTLTTYILQREPATQGDSPAEQAVNGGVAVQSVPGISQNTGEIRSRDDVIATLDRICQYYDRYEPSSPLPLLLGRAKRLAKKSFVEIVKDLTPDAMPQIQRLGGVSENGDEE
jgi:type VI secretion system protein ImpA